MFILLGALVAMTLSASDNLLTMSRSNSCLKDLVAQFVRADDCTMLDVPAKTKVKIF